MKSKTWIVAFISFMLMLTACNYPPTPAPGPSQVWITSPASGAVLPLAPVNITFEGTSLVGITEFEIRINGAEEGIVPPTSSGSCGANCGTKFFGEYQWSPPDVGDYTIALRALGNGQYSPSKEIEITITDEALEAAKPTPLPISDAGKVLVVGLQTGNCREGGGIQYNFVDTLMKDQMAEAVARSEDGSYIKIFGPNWKVECWILIELVKVEQGDVMVLPIGSYIHPPDPGSAPERPESPKPTPTSNPFGRP